VAVSAITALVLDRPRHATTVAALRQAGASVRLLPDGDIAGVVETADADMTGIDVYVGVGGATQGVFAAAALRCIGGQMQCRLLLDTDEKRERAAAIGITDPHRTYEIEDIVRGDCLFAATGVTTGSMLRGVRFRDAVVQTETVVMRSATGTVRWIRAEHRDQEKFASDSR
jgi:fructose-1,6-bisphosphatase II / sedoheptulose-1,7-bisphosphatase